MTTAAPASALARRRVRTTARLAWSSSDVGSSARSTGLASARPRATATRCCWPPLSSSTRWPWISPRPTASSASAARAAAAPGSTARASSGIRTFSWALSTAARPLPCGTTATPAEDADRRPSIASAPDRDPAGIGQHDSCHRRQQRRLAGARVTEDRDDLTGPHLQVDTGQSRHGPEAHDHSLHVHCTFRHRRPPPRARAPSDRPPRARGATSRVGAPPARAAEGAPSRRPRRPRTPHRPGPRRRPGRHGS